MVPCCQPVISKESTANVHGARCIINPTDTKAQFPALSPGQRTLTYGDDVIEHVDFYGSIHTHCVVVRRWTQHATQIELGSFFAACCIAFRNLLHSYPSLYRMNSQAINYGK